MENMLMQSHTEKLPSLQQPYPHHNFEPIYETLGHSTTFLEPKIIQPISGISTQTTTQQVGIAFALTIILHFRYFHY